MTTAEKESFVLGREEELLKGGAVLSEWATRISQEATETFVAGHHLAALLTAVAAIETQLRAEGSADRTPLHDLIDQSSLDESLKADIHILRRYRNRWVHVNQPWDDDSLLQEPEAVEEELLDMSKRSVAAMMKVLFWNQWV
jgi:hypothetical protein